MDKNKTRRQLAVRGIISALLIARQKFLRYFTVYMEFSKTKIPTIFHSIYGIFQDKNSYDISLCIWNFPRQKFLRYFTVYMEFSKTKIPMIFHCIYGIFQDKNSYDISLYIWNFSQKFTILIDLFIL
jgi:hypothetical protein